MAATFGDPMREGKRGAVEIALLPEARSHGGEREPSARMAAIREPEDRVERHRTGAAGWPRGRQVRIV